MAGPNIFAQGMGAFDDAYARTQDVRNQVTRRRAGQALAGGDRAGAAATFAGEGMIPEARQMQADQAQVENQQYQRDRQEANDQRQLSEDERAAAERSISTLKQLAQGLKGIPAGQRAQALQRALPVFQKLGMDPAPYAALTEDQLSDQNLDLYAGEIEKQWQALNLGNGGLGRFNNRTGATEIVREPDPPPVIVGNGAMAIDRDTGKTIARNAKTFAPPRSGGGGGGGLSKLSNDDLLKALRATR